MLCIAKYRNILWLPASALLGGLLFTAPLLLRDATDAALISFFLVVPLVSTAVLALSVWRFRRHWLASSLALFLLGLCLWARWTWSEELHERSLWLLHSETYKKAAWAAPAAPKTGQRHTLLDSWGFAGAGETLVEAVFDPTDSLDRAASRGEPAILPLTSCEVYRVRRLGSHWYAVQFYTDTSWEDCVNQQPEGLNRERF